MPKRKAELEITMSQPRTYKKARTRKSSMYKTSKTIIGKRRKATLRYFTQISLGGTVGPDAHIFSANGCYDPDITGIGNQPRGWDQIMALYDHAVVTKANCKVYAAATASNVSAALISIQSRDSAIVETAARDVMEYGIKDTRILGGTDTNRVAVFDHTVYPGTFLGRSSIMSDPQLKNSISSNPSEQVYFHIYDILASSTSGNSPDVLLNVELTYDVVFIEPKDPVSS